MMKVFLLVLALCACAVSAYDICRFSTEDGKVEFIFRVPDNVYSKMTEKELEEMKLEEEGASYRFVATSYSCLDTFGSDLAHRHLIVDSDPYDRNYTQSVLFNHEAGNKKVHLMNGTTVVGGVVSFITKRETICIIFAWHTWKTVDGRNSSILHVAYSSPNTEKREDVHTYVVPRGRREGSVPICYREYEEVVERMAIGELSNPFTRKYATMIAQCGTFSSEELNQPAEPITSVGNIDNFYLQSCRRIRAAETISTSAEEGIIKKEWMFLISIFIGALFLSVNWGYVWAWLRSRSFSC